MSPPSRDVPEAPPEDDAAEKGVGKLVLRQTAIFAALRTLSSLLTWVGIIVLSRILEPRAFGAFEIGYFWLGLGQLIGDGGLAASLIRHQGELTRKHWQVAFTMAFSLGALMAVAFYFAVPSLGAASGLLPREIDALRVLSPLFLVPVFRMIPYVQLEREVNFAMIGRIDLAGNLVRHVTAIAGALIFNDVWALIASQIMWNLTHIVVAYSVRPGLSGFGFDRAIFKELFSFGSKVQLGNMFLYMKNNVGRGLLGFAMGPAAVGVFSFGLNFVNVPPDAVNGLARVQFPVYARLKQHDIELYQLVRGAMRGSLLVGLPILGVLVSAADWIVPTVYSEQWLPSLPVVWALLPHIMGDLLIVHLITFIQAQGRAGLALWMYGFWALSLWGLVSISLWGFEGNLAMVAACYGVATTLTVVALLRWAGGYLGKRLSLDVLGPLCAGGLAMGLAFFARQSLARGSLVSALLCLGVFLGAFAALLFAFERRAAWDDVKGAIHTLRAR